jgi:ATP-binding cassette subfamily B protein
VLKLVRYLRAYKKEVFFGPLCKLLEAIFELLLPTIMAKMINDGVGRGDLAEVTRLGALMVGMAVFGFASALVCQYLASRASQGFGTALRKDLFARVSELSLERLDAFGTQSLTNRITNDVNALQLAVAMLIRLVVRAPFICVGAIAMAMILNLRLSLILIAAAPLLALVIWLVATKTSPLYRAYQGKLDGLAEAVRENLSGVRVIRSFARREDEEARFGKANAELMDRGFGMAKVSALLNPATTLVVNAAVIAILWFGGLMVRDGTFLRGEIVAYVNYVTQILLALIVVSNLVIIFSKAAAAAARVNEILDIPPEEAREGKLGALAPASVPALELRGVGYSYPDGGNALRDISLIIERGWTLGVIGGTGAGKSTLAAVLAGLYPPSAGTLLLNGKDASALDPAEQRRAVGLAPQKAKLFSGTVGWNILLGASSRMDRLGNQETAAREAVREAARIAQADEFISGLERGYETLIERGGANLSGGQRQRLNVARAVIANPEILILDDSSSALDYSTDAALRRELKKARQGLTTVIISQRAAAIRDADRILVLSHGRVSGFGSHAELMEGCPEYREIVESQD